MLEPDTRELLLDLLRPPEGWDLGHAIGTTFTLDLQTLLTAPLAFAMFDWAVDEEGRADPIAILEALRRHAERTTLFCQAGMIGLPAEYQPLLIHLEDCVVPVTAPTDGGIFHPKVWLLQFVREGDDPRYRLVTLSRNLTFDTSWDTVVTLEGTRRRKRPHSEAVATFVRQLVDLGGSRLIPSRRRDLLAVADDVTHVRFDRPDGVDDVRFHPLGFDGAAWPLPEDGDRALVVSPFLGPGALQRITASGDDHVLVSRPESLDEVGADALPFARTAVLSSDVLSDDALDQDVDPATAAEDGAGANGRLRGLHAKVFAFERGDRLQLLTGSANATRAAFERNVEFLVELRASTRRLSIDGFLEGQEGVTAFGALLEDYTPADTPAESDPADEVAAMLEGVQRRIGALDLRAEVTTAEDRDDEFRVELHADQPLHLPDGVREVHCWRITAGQGHQVTPRIGADGLHAAFGHVAYEGLTSFYAFEVVGDAGGRTDRVRFVVNARLVGAPTDRVETVIARLLKNRDDLLRYLLFLLSDTSGSMAELVADIAAGIQLGAGDRQPLLGRPALLETLLRALVRDPSRIDNVGRLLDDLEAAGRRDDLAPEGLLELWAAIEKVHGELAGGGA